MSSNKRQSPRNERPHNRPYLQEFRTRLRKNLTPAEAAMWQMLKGTQVDGRKFRRQHSVGNYILDFFCPSEKLAVELDGEGHYHALTEISDQARKRYLSELGIRVLRFENKLVFDDPGFVLTRIRANFGWWNSRTIPEVDAFRVLYHPDRRSGGHPS
ncbi:MAG TPA: DUF559 domain-containing protein [Pyrinomonadaceae bacterium]|nr:DUF559 domain-containing protein [Pyrinomonadaceae bacterium]